MAPSIDPVILAVVTSGVTHLALKTYEGAISIATKELWEAIKSRFGWKEDPPKETLAKDIATKLKNDEPLLNEIVRLLKSTPDEGGDSAILIRNIEADKVVVAHSIVTQNFNM